MIVGAMFGAQVAALPRPMCVSCHSIHPELLPDPGYVGRRTPAGLRVDRAKRAWLSLAAVMLNPGRDDFPLPLHQLPGVVLR